jgi:hypothetical protein
MSGRRSAGEALLPTAHRLCEGRVTDAIAACGGTRVEANRSAVRSQDREKVELKWWVATTQSTTMSDCPICYTAMTPATGSTVLGCSHSFHLTCIVGWFQEQAEKGETNTCPCCRRAAGEYDTLPLRGNVVAKPLPTMLLVLASAAESRPPTWIRYGEACWMTTDGMELWLSEWAGEAAPPASLWLAMLEAATTLQALWRGYRVRREVCAAKMLCEVQANLGLV